MSGKPPLSGPPSGPETSLETSSARRMDPNKRVSIAEEHNQVRLRTIRRRDWPGCGVFCGYVGATGRVAEYSADTLARLA
eukprot:557301-Prorocentrum_minimum.AAC.1